jgi:predicted metalloprotease
MRRLAQLFVAMFVAVAPMLSVQVVPAHAETQTLESFVGGVESQIDDFWRQSSLSHGMLYSSPRVALVGRGRAVYDACGPTPVESHEYCSRDHTLYLDVSSRYPVSFGSLWAAQQQFAIVTILAHEWGHHVQAVYGINWQGLRQIQLEQQADCFAGAFGRHARVQGWLESDELSQGLDVSLRSGDPSHGSGYDRALSLMQGYSGSDPVVCIARS